MSNMQESITQELDYGCGVACFAFVCGMTFQQAVAYLGKEYSVKHGWRPSDLVSGLNRFGYKYRNRYVRKKVDGEYPDGTIVLIERSEVYPVGHYLVVTKVGYMDPWINMPMSNDISLAESGFRNVLPGKAMYVLIPEE
jgi:hypothetical protein